MYVNIVTCYSFLLSLDKGVGEGNVGYLVERITVPSIDLLIRSQCPMQVAEINIVSPKGFV